MKKPLFTDVLARLGIREVNSGVFAGEFVSQPGGPEIASVNPATGETIARVRSASRADYDRAVAVAKRAFEIWRLVPPPRRGEVVRLIGDALRRHKSDLGLLVTLEVGKIRSEGAGEVQEMIDMCDYAVGLSRQLYGLTIASERANHRMLEQWHPLGPTGIITAFNFPVAVWAWNAMLAAVCGDTCIWKPSHLTPLTAIAVQNIVDEVVRPLGYSGVFSLVVGDRDVGEWMAEDSRLPLISATGSTAMGKSVGAIVAGRMGRSLLELGGNNGLVLTESADQDLALRAVLFSAVGTAGQRCTTLRRLIIHDSIADAFISKLAKAYGSVPIGEPWESEILMGPLIHEKAVEQMLAAVEQAKKEGGTVVCGGTKVNRAGHFVQPTIIRAKAGMNIVSCETFAPILYVLTFKTLDEAIAIHNSVPQGLSSAIFTERLKEAERFLSVAGSDCGIANVNIGTSGAEIGGAFGGEKETGGGREAGSDSWKAYMRRQTCTINFGNDLPLAQGVKFEVT